MTTLPEVFVIESLDPDDEGNGRMEGVFLGHMLRLHGKRPEYRYVRTRKQFVNALSEFGDSKYRYLHVSAHANRMGLETTNRDVIVCADFVKQLQPCLKSRRLFLSACKFVHKELAQAVIESTGAISIVGPTKNITFQDAAIVWAAVYHLVFTEDSKRITGDSLLEKLRLVCELFGVDFAYYAKSTSRKSGVSQNLLAS